MKPRPIEDEVGLTDEQKQKLKEFHLTFHERITKWRAINGTQELPIYWIERDKRWVWATRADRRAMEKVRRMKAKAIKKARETLSAEGSSQETSPKPNT